MAKQTKLAVISDLGTFTRTTARTYTHLVVVKGLKHEGRERQRRHTINTLTEELAEYRLTVATGVCQKPRAGQSGDWDRKCTAQFLAEGLYTEWIANAEARLASPELTTPITEDGAGDYDAIGWCGRLDLAAKLFATADAYRHAAIIEVATGHIVTGR